MTVRALHHYDEIGLVSPRRRSAAGYRLYGEEDVARLLRVLLLRRLGLSLEEVRAGLDRPEGALPGLLRRQVTRLREQVALQQRALGRLESLADRLERGGAAPLDELIDTMETIAMFEKHYTPEQLEQIAQRGKELGPERIAQAEAEWPQLIAQMKTAMERGADPASPEVRALAERWRALVRAFTGGDAGIQRSLNTMYAQEPALQQRTGIDPSLMEYVGRAMAAL
jgi:DNA-binding transcriptional MerR regulator